MKKIFAIKNNFNIVEEFGSNQFIKTPVWINLAAFIVLVTYILTDLSQDVFGGMPKKILIAFSLFSIFKFNFDLKKNGIFVLFLFSCLVPFISWLGVLFCCPEYAEASPEIQRLANLYMLIPVALWSGGDTKKVFIVWVIALSGLLLVPWFIGSGVNEWIQGFSGVRTSFGFRNAQHSGMLFGVCFIGLLVFSGRFISYGIASKLVRYLFLLALIFLSFLVILFSQTRGVWLGLFFCLFFVLIPLEIYRFHFRYDNICNRKILTLFIIIPVLLFFSPSSDRFTDRLTREFNFGELFLNGESFVHDYSGIGVRLNFWKESFSWINERPIIGWGGQGRKLVIKKSAEFPQRLKKVFGHLHNSYLDLLVNYGVLGLAVSLGLISWFIIKCFKAWRDKNLPSDVAAFGVIFLIFWLIVNCFESYMFYASGGFVFSLVAGGLLNFIWLNQQAQEGAVKSDASLHRTSE